MPLSRDAFVSNYLEELKENVERVDSGILALKKDPENTDELGTLLRALHTIKGSSRMLKFNCIERISHGMENVLKGVKEQRYGISQELIQLVFVSTDLIREAARRIRSGAGDDVDVTRLLGTYEKACANEPYDVRSLRVSAPSSSTTGGAESGEVASDYGSGDESTEPAADHSIESIRIDVDKVENIIRQLNNLIIKQFQFRKENETLLDLEQRISNLVEAPSGIESLETLVREEGSACLKSLQQLRKAFSQELESLERNTFELQEEVFSLRMLPLELVLGSLGKMVEETAIMTGKEIEFSASGMEVQLDKFILERLHDPVIHIIRNAVDHGLELPEERVAAGKLRSGKLSVTCSSEGGNVIVSIKDDGRGIDYEKIRRKAIEFYPAQEMEIREMEPAGLNAFLFAPGFSTKDEVSELSGRGIGLDIVHHNIEKIKGKITLTSERGVGTEFRLSLPLSLATVDGFFVAAGGRKFLVPSTFVKEVIIVRREDELDLHSRKGFRLRDAIVPIYHLDAILDGEQSGSDPPKLLVVVVESMGEIIGMAVDEVIQYTSLIYKPVPRNLSGLKVIQGIVFDESYNIINILFIPEIIRRLKHIRNIDRRQRFSTDRRESKRILVVDDSYTSREIEKSILELENYSVTAAADGIEALDLMKKNHFHLVVTDIHMPRMDGFTLIENLQKDERNSETPVIVVSSDADAGMKHRFEEAGARAVIAKSDFNRGDLIRTVKELIG